ncbi:MAG: hypothetical protein HY667_03660, partial [Chloroflexi bacterium]|nr:hypothetical protein [Chloroflexota bacterium]
DNASVIYYATSSAVFKSTDAGASFTSLPEKPGGAGSGNIGITSIDITTYGSRYMVAVATRDADAGEFGGVYVLDENDPFGGWLNTNLAGHDVYAVALSPDFTRDNGIIAVVSDETNTFVTTLLSSVWGMAIGNAVIGGITPVSADIAFPDDFHADSEGSMFFVAVDTGTGNGDVYRIISMMAPANSIVTDLNIGAAYGAAGTDVTALAVTGNADTAHLLAGGGGTVQVYASDDGGTNWIRSTKPPTGGGKTEVLMAIDYAVSGKAYAATNGAESALSYSIDYGASWDQFSLIDTQITAVIDVAPSPDYAHDNSLFVLTAGNKNSLWRSTDGGASWVRILTGGLPGIDSFTRVSLSPHYSRDNPVLFVAGTSGGNPAIWKSTVGGNSFSPPKPSRNPATGVPVPIDRWTVINDDSLFITSFDGANGLVYLVTGGGSMYSAGIVVGNVSLSNIVLSPEYEKDKNIPTGNTNGQVYWSQDGGVSFDPLPVDTVSPLAGVLNVAFDPDFSQNKIVYAFSPTKGIYRFVTGKSKNWENIDSVPAVGSTMNQLNLSANGVLYLANAKANGGLERSLNPGYSPGPTFETITSGLESNTMLLGAWLSGNRLWSYDSANKQLMTYTDTLTMPVVLDSPSDKAPGIDPNDITLDWQAAQGATTYKWQLDYDTGFGNAVEAQESGSRASPANLPTFKLATTYFWRVRATGPVLSPWSEIRSFTTRLGTEVVSLKLTAPEAGADKVSVKPVLQWSAIAGAEKYELLVATEPSFATPLISKTLLATAWQCETSLEYGTTYYWRVRAVSASSFSAWSLVNAFTTEPLPKASPTPTPQSTPTPLPTSSPQPTVTVTPPLPPVNLILPSSLAVAERDPKIEATIPAKAPVDGVEQPPAQIVAPGTPQWATWLIYLGSAIFVVMLALLVTMVVFTIRVWRQ